MRRILSGVLAATWCVMVAASAVAAERPSLLFVSSFNKDLPAQQALERGLTQALGPGGADVHTEFLDSPRIPAKVAADAFSAVVERKYASMHFDAVVAWTGPAARAVARERARLGGARMIFVEIPRATLAEVVDPAAADIVVTLGVDYRKSVTQALRLSRAERLVVVGDNAPGLAAERVSQFREALAAEAPRLPVEDLTGRPLDQVVERVAQLPPRSAIFYLLTFSDERGAPITPFEVAQRISAAATAPVFSAWESLMGSGVVGGALLSQETAGRQIGEAVAAIARGDRPLPPGEAIRNIFDWRQLQRWKIPAASLPADARVLGRPPELLDQYGTEIALAACAFAALAILAALLARALHGRNRALAALAEERASLARKVQERTGQLSAAARDLERSNSELEQFAYAASHDLRQPLRMVAGYVGLIGKRLGPEADADLAEYMAFATNGARRMDAMINGLLEYSRVGRTGDPPERIGLAEVIAEAKENLQLALAERGAEVTVAGDLPAVTVRRAEMVRLFQNLIDNATKFVPADRPPRITVTWTADDQALRVSVADNGIGIPPDQRERLFGVFQRLVTSEQYEGTGIGLALCRKIAAHHGGHIEVGDAPGGGSVFTIELPLNRAG
ncbi:ATP-binding protein [Magnetospirillum sp. UT-4]|uniref:sensor histidine kinase n=1 Tax=Magnetospirillum sp. UT-4 TaxID=2681467 RepID=UPI0013862A5F|nr:ATP-binding protein [Magnetospirillum sp. UT-4]CAA7626371.1 putative Histidine kinase [Magnetospirillum sp. UT-4]